MPYTVRLPVPVTEEWDWQRHAACRDLNTARFFHPAAERGRAAARREDQAKRVCAACLVREQCLEYSLRAEEPYGVWGGVGERQRWRMVMRRRRARRATTSGTSSRSGLSA